MRMTKRMQDRIACGSVCWPHPADRHREEATTGTKAKYTPGPWHPTELRRGWDGLGHGDYRLYDAEQLPICTVDGGDGPENLANARLIATAPDLLEAAKALLNTVSFGGHDTIRDKGYVCLALALPEILRLWATIAKAEGSAV